MRLAPSPIMTARRSCADQEQQKETKCGLNPPNRPGSNSPEIDPGLFFFFCPHRSQVYGGYACCGAQFLAMRPREFRASGTTVLKRRGLRFFLPPTLKLQDLLRGLESQP